MKHVLLFLLLFPGFLPSKSPAATIDEVVPGTLYLEAGGKQVTLVLRGNDLPSIRQMIVKKQGQVVAGIYSQLGPPAEQRRTVAFIASPQCLLGSDYQAVAVLSETESVALPLSFNVVKAGDPRISLPDTATLAESTKSQSGKRIVVAESQAPVVTGSIPDPLIIIPNGKTQKIILKGKNLQAITELRVRKADKPARYKGSQGILPMKHVAGGLEVEMMAAAGSAEGTLFTLDLMVQKYLAASLSVKVGYPGPEIPQTNKAPTADPLVIPLVPGPVQNP